MDGEDVMKVEVYKERREHWKGDGKKREREKRNRRKSSCRRKCTGPPRCKPSLLGNTCIEPHTHLLLNKKEILPCICPRAEPIVVPSHLL